MNKILRLKRMIYTLGIITLFSLGFSAYSLTHIANEININMTLDWNIVRMGFLFTIIFMALTINYIIAIHDNENL